MSDHPEVIVEDHQTEDSLTSEQHGDVPVEAVTPSQQYNVGITLNYILVFSLIINDQRKVIDLPL